MADQRWRRAEQVSFYGTILMAVIGGLYVTFFAFSLFAFILWIVGLMIGHRLMGWTGRRV